MATTRDWAPPFNTDASCSILNHHGVCCLLFSFAYFIFVFSRIFNAAYNLANIDNFFDPFVAKHSRWYHVSRSTLRPSGWDQEGAMLYSRKERKPEVNKNG
jgi:hypothetical protein